MKIGIVLSKTPNYSETFFESKINGLLAKGHTVTLFVQVNDTAFDTCKVVLVPSVTKANTLINILYISRVIFMLLLRSPKRLYNFMCLEKKSGRTWTQIAKNCYNNSHILQSELDWVHFGFATMALHSEHVAKAIGAQMAVSLRGYDMDVYPRTHKDCYRLLWKHVDKVHAISKYMLKTAYELGLSKQTPYAVITPALSITTFRNSHPIRSNNNFLLTVGRLHWIKGLADTLKAIAILKSQGISINYRIVGDGPELEALEHLIHQLKLHKNVFLVGKKTHDEVFEEFKKASVYIQYSESEGFCNAVLEAQAMGLLCIVSDGGALPENVIDGVTGWVVPKKNPDDLAKAIRKVLNLPEIEKERIIKKARFRVETEFNLDVQAQKFDDFYRQAIL